MTTKLSDIENAGVYQVKVSKEGILSENGIIGRPTSEVKLKNTDFYDGLADPAHFLALVASDKIEITNFHELNHLLDTINFKLDSRKTNNKKSPTQPKYIYYEGEGYIEETARLLSKGKVIGGFRMSPNLARGLWAGGASLLIQGKRVSMIISIWR